MSSQIGEDPPRRRGRPRNFDDADLLDALTDTFWRKGFADTSLDDLTTATGAARASLYKLFGDKEVLVIAALDHYAARFDARVTATCATARRPLEAVAETLRASADRLSSGAAPPGCLRCRLTLEMSGRSSEIDAALHRANSEFSANIERLLSLDGRAPGPTPGRIRQAALFLTAVVNGMVVLAETGASREDLEEVIALAVANLPVS